MIPYEVHGGGVKFAFLCLDVEMVVKQAVEHGLYLLNVFVQSDEDFVVSKLFQGRRNQW